jgi:hypothetical protein
MPSGEDAGRHLASAKTSVTINSLGQWGSEGEAGKEWPSAWCGGMVGPRVEQGAS